MPRLTEDAAPVRLPPLYELLGTAMPTADEAGTVGGFIGPTREDILARGLNQPKAPDLLAALRQFAAPGVAAVERGLSPDGDPDLPGPLRIAGQAAGKALELTPFPAKSRLDSGFKYETEDDRRADLMALLPGFGAAGTIWKQGGKKAPQVVKAVTEAVDDIRAPKIADEIPGFRKTALDKVRERGEPPKAPHVDDPYQLGSRLEKFDISEDSLNLIRRNALEDMESAGTDIAFSAQRRGVQSMSEIDRKASLIAESIDIEKVARTKAGTALNAHELGGVVKATAQRAVALDKLNTEIQKVGTENATSDMKLAALKMALELNSLQRVLAGARAESGRTQRALREINGAIASKTEQAYDKAFKVVGGRADAEHKIAKLQDIWNDSSRSPEARERDVFNFVRQLDKAGTWRKLEEFWLNSILSNPITHEINIIGNALLLTAERLPTRLAAATIEELVTIHGTRRTKEVTFTDTAVGAIATFTAIKKATQKALMYAKTGVSEQDVNKFREAGTVGRKQALEGSAGTILNIPTRALGVEDAWFYTLAQESEAASRAARQAMKEGLTPFSGKFLRRVAELKQTDEIQEAASKSADYITLKSKPDQITQKILDLRRVVPGAPLFIPFVQTPMNLLKRGWDYSPLGISSMFRQGMTQEDKALALGRVVVGSSVMAYFMTKVLEGNVTGPAPSDTKARQLFYDSHKRPFAIKVGDKWVEWGRMDPFAMPLRWATALKDVYDTNGGKVNQDVIGPMLAALGRALIDTTYMSGMSGFINALEDPHGSGERTLSRIASGYVPFSGFLRGLTGTQDPYLRSADDLLERISAGLPGLSETVSPIYNVLGEPTTRPESRQGVGALVNPLVIEGRQPHPVIAEDVRLASVFGKKSLDGKAEYTGISKPSDSVSGVPLTGPQHDRLQEVVGQARKKVLSDLMASTEYNQASDVRKLELWEKASADAARSGRKALGLEVALGGDPIGAKIAVANSTSNFDKGATLSVLQQQGALTPEAIAAIEADRTQTDPKKNDYDLSVSEYLHGHKIRSAWDRAPQFIFGTRGQWDAAARAAEQYKRLIKGLTAEQREMNANITRFYYSAAGGALQTFYGTDGSRNMDYVHPTRLAIEKDRLWGRFRPAAASD